MSSGARLRRIEERMRKKKRGRFFFNMIYLDKNPDPLRDQAFIQEHSIYGDPDDPAKPSPINFIMPRGHAHADDKQSRIPAVPIPGNSHDPR